MPLPTASSAGRVQAHAAQTCLASPFFANSLKQAAPRAHHARASPSTMGPISAVAAEPRLERPDATGRFGRFGGKYVPETLIAALAELEVAYAEAMADPEFVVRQAGTAARRGPPHVATHAVAASHANGGRLLSRPALPTLSPHPPRRFLGRRS